MMPENVKIISEWKLLFAVCRETFGCFQQTNSGITLTDPINMTPAMFAASRIKDEK